MAPRKLLLLPLAVLFPVVALAYTPRAMTIDGRAGHALSERTPGSWHNDVLEHPWGDYPFEAKSKRWEGTGWFRLQLRPDGSVTNVQIMQSTGYSILDQSAIAAFQHWRFKPNKWKWVDEPMWFSLHGRRL